MHTNEVLSIHSNYIIVALKSWSQQCWPWWRWRDPQKFNHHPFQKKPQTWDGFQFWVKDNNVWKNWQMSWIYNTKLLDGVAALPGFQQPMRISAAEKAQQWRHALHICCCRVWLHIHYMEVSPTMFNGPHSQAGMQRITGETQFNLGGEIPW